LQEFSLELGSVLQVPDNRSSMSISPTGNDFPSGCDVGRQGIETATVGSEGVVGAMSGFGFRRGFTRAVVQAPLVAGRISCTHFRQPSE